jgi:hypothetical protein
MDTCWRAFRARRRRHATRSGGTGIRCYTERTAYKKIRRP